MSKIRSHLSRLTGKAPVSSNPSSPAKAKNSVNSHSALLAVARYWAPMSSLTVVSGVGRRLAWGGMAAAGAVLAGALVVRYPLLSVAAVAAGFAGLAVLDRNVALLSAITVVALAWGSSTVGPTSVAFLVKFAAMAALAATLLDSFAASRLHLPLSPGFVMASAGLGCLALASATWSVDPQETLARGLSLLLLWSAITAVLVRLSNTDEVPDMLLRFGMILAIVNLLGMVATALGLVSGFLTAGRFQGLLVNPNTLGYFAAPILPPVIVIAAGMSAGRRRRIVLGAVLTVGIGLALSGSRGGAAAAVAGTVAGLLVARGRWRIGTSRIVAIVVVTLIAAVMVFPLLNLSLRTGGGSSEGFFELGTGSAREQAWGEGLALALERPVAGHGFATTPLLLPARQTASQGNILVVAHNSYLEAGIDLGVPGVAWLTLLALSGAVAAYRVARAGGPDSAVAAMLLSGIVGGMVGGLVETGMLNAGGLLAFPFWLLVALAHSLRFRQRRASIAGGSDAAR